MSWQYSTFWLGDDVDVEFIGHPLLWDEPLDSKPVFGDAGEPNPLDFADDLVDVVFVAESIQNRRVQFAL